MSSHSRWGLALATSLVALVVSATNVSAQFAPGYATGFEPAGPTEEFGYASGTLEFQIPWVGGADPTRFPWVQTEAEIQAKLTEAGLNTAGAVHSGNQALMVTKGGNFTEASPPGGYLVRASTTGLALAQNVIADFWVRPLTTGGGGDPTGVIPGTPNWIGERQGNFFIGIDDLAGKRAAAIRFGTDNPAGTQPVDQSITERHIDIASADVVTGFPWRKSGQLWEANTWYNIKLDMDFVAKTYDFFLDGSKVNTSPIRFYEEVTTDAARILVSRGTNQAGGILDDIKIYEKLPPTADFDDDGDVDGNDFLVWQRDQNVGSLANWQAEFGQVGATAAFGSVPEPAGAVVMIGLLAGLGRRRRS